MLFIATLGLSACSSVFEHDFDVRAKKALQDLMAIQDSYYQENGKYARNLIQIEKYNLKFHTGIVYLEIESADKNGYRAISLPAESTTARVFAFDSAKGGYYEMDDAEVSSYVLGALNSIRTEQKELAIKDGASIFMIFILLCFWLKAFLNPENREHKSTMYLFLICLGPLLWSMAALNHMHKDILASSLILTCIGAAIAVSVFGSVMGTIGFTKLFQRPTPGPVIGFSVSTLFISLFSLGTMIYILMRYYK